MDFDIVNALFEKLVKTLIENKLSITCMESITGGTFATLITNISGSSGIFRGSFVTYSNEAKITEGVNPDIIDEYSVYSLETATEMARAAKEIMGADIGIGITGTAGNTDPANASFSIPGEVYYAINVSGQEFCEKITLKPNESRFSLKLEICRYIAETLLTLL